MLQGICTVSLWAGDHAAAVRWYTDLLGFAPYFERPGYAEFRVGDYQQELGLIDSRYAPAGAQSGPAGVIVYWQVDDVATAVGRLISQGATEYEPLTPRGPGFVTASVLDPFGNILGVMENAHFREVLASASS